MANGIIEKTAVAATDVNAYNRTVVSAAAVENGSVMSVGAMSSTAGEDEVFVGTAPTTGDLSNLWMAATPEVVVTAAKYKGLDPDPRNFTNAIGDMIAAFRPVLGDLVEMSADAVAGTISTNTFVVATNAASKLTWAAAAVSGLSLKLRKTTTMSIGTGAIGSHKILSYLFEVVAVA